MVTPLGVGEAKQRLGEKRREKKNLFQNGDEDLPVHWKTIEIAKRGSLIVGCRNYFFCFAVDLTDSGSGCVCSIWTTCENYFESSLGIMLLL